MKVPGFKFRKRLDTEMFPSGSSPYFLRTQILVQYFKNREVSEMWS